MDPRAHNTEENTSHKGHHQVLIVLRSLIVSLQGVIFNAFIIKNCC